MRKLIKEYIFGVKLKSFYQIELYEYIIRK